MSRLLIVGAGGHGKVVAETAIASGRWKEIAFVDQGYTRGTTVLGWPVIGVDTDALHLRSEYAQSFVALGDNRLRVERVERLLDAGFELPCVIHPAAWVSPSATLHEGTVIIAGAVVNAGSVLGRGCIVNTGATVDHDCVLGDGVHISPGAHIGGGTSIGARSWIGIGAAVRHSLKIGSDVLVGAGAAVVADLPSGVRAIGVPARAENK